MQLAFDEFEAAFPESRFAHNVTAAANGLTQIDDPGFLKRLESHRPATFEHCQPVDSDDLREHHVPRMDAARCAMLDHERLAFEHQVAQEESAAGLDAYRLVKAERSAGTGFK